MNYHFFCRVFNPYYFLILFLFCPSNSFAIDSESDREKIVSARSRAFSRSDRVRKTLLLGGNQNSDQNSKERRVDSRYYHRSKRQMHEILFLQKTRYSNLGTADHKHHLVKKSELYDGTISNKFMLYNTNNYGVTYGRAKYDDLSSYYYDFRGAVGVGRAFLNDKIEFDTSVGYLDIKNSGSKYFLMPSVRLNLRISKNLTFRQRGYVFLDHESMDNDLRTSLKYRISKKVSLSLNHTVEQRKYEDLDDRETVNNSSRFISFGLVFDLN